MSCCETPPSVTLNIHNGDSYEHTFIWTGSDEVPIDITGYDARLNVVTEAGIEPIVKLTVGDGITIDGPAGKIVCQFSPAQTTLLFTGMVWDLELNDNGTITTIIQGDLCISPDKTV